MSGAAVFAATGRRPPRPRAKTGSPFTLARLELLKVRGSSFWWMLLGMMLLVSAWAGMAFMKRAGSPVPALRSAALADGEVYQVVSLLAPILAALLTSRIAVLETSERMNLTWLSFGQSDAARFVGKLIVAGTGVGLCFLIPLLWVPIAAKALGFTVAGSFAALVWVPALTGFLSVTATSAVQLMFSMMIDKQAIGLGLGVIAGVLGSGLGAMNRPALGWLFPAGLSSAASPFVRSVDAGGNATMLLAARPWMAVASAAMAFLGWTLVSMVVVKVKESRRTMTHANAVNPAINPAANPAAGPSHAAMPRAHAAGRRRPSVWAAFRWETRKAGNLWYWIVTVLFDAIGMFNGWSQYTGYQAEFARQGVAWAAIWGQAILLPSMVFMPVLVAAFAAQVEANEHRGRNWQRLNAAGTVNAAIAGKMLHGLAASALTVLVFEAEFILVGRFAAGFDLAQLGPFLLRGIPLTLSVWAIMTLTQAVSAKAESFAGTMSVMMVLTIGGCALSLAAPVVAGPYPLALITSASAARDLANIASPASMLASTTAAAIWTAISALIFHRLAKQAV